VGNPALCPIVGENVLVESFHGGHNLGELVAVAAGVPPERGGKVSIFPAHAEALFRRAKMVTSPAVGR
jgi:hypothetical protein